MSDGLFFSVCIVFFFILWIAGGGPTKPISFAGPFITPITNEGQTQSGYGPQLKLPVAATISNNGTSVTAGVRSTSNSDTSSGIANTSPYAGEVTLVHQVGGLTSSDPSKEYLDIKLASTVSTDVDITGWKVKSAVSGASATIPQGAKSLKLGPISLQDIELSPGNSAVITTGASPVSVSFEQNTCDSYLSKESTYNQCVDNESSSSNFLTGIWSVYLDKNVRLWKNSSETIELIDGSGKVVDNFSY